MNSVLFLCTGNYYRSRMAEELFNFWARNAEIEWRADSAGLRDDMDASPNEGTISGHVIRMLSRSGFPIKSAERRPRSITEENLEKMDLVICMHRNEHEPMLQKRFPGNASEILYWDVPDIHFMEAEEAFDIIQKQIQQLISILSSSRRYIISAD